MPDNVDARGSADGTAVHSDDNSPDLVGEELGDGARIWRVYDQVAREEDRERIGTWNRGLDNLALFAGLFSAVTTAFIIQLQQDTQPDYARLTFLVLNASAAGAPFHDEPFAIDRDVRTTNCLWISSLMLSLTAALIAIMGKDWIGMYASRPVCNPRQWAEIRTYRLACVDRWYMSGVIASAPVLLHISLVLFAAGLVIFVSPDPFSQRVALGLTLGAGGLYLCTVLGAIAFPSSPFKSPATQAVRAAIGSIFTSLDNRLVHPPKLRPIALLKHAVLIMRTAPLRSRQADSLPMEQSRHRRLWRGHFRTIWQHLFSRPSSAQARSLRDVTAGVFRAASRALSRLSPPALWRYARKECIYRCQRPRGRPWYYPAQSYLRRTVISDHWAECRDKPTPVIVARALSHLNVMTQATDVFRCTLIALGDIAVGSEVAPLVSSALKSRLETEIRNNWPKVDLVTLSRYIMADLHLWDTRVIPARVTERFLRTYNAVKSESILFALIELSRTHHITAATIAHYCPELVIQPRSLKYLLPRVDNYEVTILLAQRYWNYLRDDQSVNLDDELRRTLGSLGVYHHRLYELDHLSGGRAGLPELLVDTVAYLKPEIITIACALILKVISAEPRVQEHPCLVYAFGHKEPWIADAAWAAVPNYFPPEPPFSGSMMHQYLPLEQFDLHGECIGRPRRDDYLTLEFEICLARTIVRLLSPSRYFWVTARWIWEEFGTIKVSTYMSTLELCVRYLHMYLYRQVAPCDGTKREIITLLLEKSALIRVCSLWKYRHNSSTQPTERHVMGILTAIARQMPALLADKEEYDANVRLFCLFSFSEAKDWEGKPITWDLGSYLRTALVLVSGQGSSTKASMRDIPSMRDLLWAIRALRPLCMPDDNLRAAWERIDITSSSYDSFWDTESTPPDPGASEDRESLQWNPSSLVVVD